MSFCITQQKQCFACYHLISNVTININSSSFINLILRNSNKSLPWVSVVEGRDLMATALSPQPLSILSLTPQTTLKLSTQLCQSVTAIAQVEGRWFVIVMKTSPFRQVEFENEQQKTNSQPGSSFTSKSSFFESCNDSIQTPGLNINWALIALGDKWPMVYGRINYSHWFLFVRATKAPTNRRVLQLAQPVFTEYLNTKGGILINWLQVIKKQVHEHWQCRIKCIPANKQYELMSGKLFLGSLLFSTLDARGKRQFQIQLQMVSWI